MSRPRLLLLGQTLPFPPDSGVNIRMYNVLRLLSRTFDVTALFFYRQSERRRASEVESSVAGLRAFGHIEAFPIPQERSTIRFLWDHFRSVILQRAYTWFSLDSATYRARVRELVETQAFDLVQIDSLDLACYVADLKALPVVCVHHNVESELIRRRAVAQSTWWSRRYMEMQAELLEKLERAWCDHFALNVAVSELDMAVLQRFAPRAKFACVPNGVDLGKFHAEIGTDHGIVSVGGTHWFPNQDALAFFASEILPRVRASIPDIPVVWVGRSTDEELSSYRAAHGITLTGYVEDVRPFFRDAACFVVPLRVGGGTRLKILDAWAMGKAIVSTSVGCEGLAARDGENLLIRDSPEAFAAGVLEVLGDAQLRARLGRGARDTAERVYSWDVIGTGLLSEYSRLIHPSPVTTSP